ncbi:MAG TPA: hypothetical protein VMF51_23500 [Nocardioides sp.]|uniref:hypothetical protein n=1 Tax=Nocardioides sp. TaxID=35761 RepID=UPI002BB2A552|nr:hypothetical protein [Nocardioides sp.]HTW18111.1 hypothetical protein [Nocardioides sp.]
MSDQQADQQVGPDPSYGRRALSTRGYVAAVVVPVVIAAALFGLVVWNYDDADVEGSTAPLLVSAWQPGQDDGGEQIVGVLEQGDRNCPVLSSADGSLVVAWPAGYSARVSAGGTLTVYDPGNAVAVREGQEIRAVGSLVDAEGSEFVGRPCAPETGRIAAIQSEVQVVG